MIHLNEKAFLQLQGNISDAAFARKLGVSRSQLWRIRTKKSAVGGDFIEKFMISYPDLSVNEYFFVADVPKTAHMSDNDINSKTFFSSGCVGNGTSGLP